MVPEIEDDGDKAISLQNQMLLKRVMSTMLSKLNSENANGASYASPHASSKSDDVNFTRHYPETLYYFDY